MKEESPRQKIMYKAERLIVTFGNAKRALDHQTNVVKELGVQGLRENVNYQIKRQLEALVNEKERYEAIRRDS